MFPEQSNKFSVHNWACALVTPVNLIAKYPIIIETIQYFMVSFPKKSEALRE